MAMFRRRRLRGGRRLGSRSGFDEAATISASTRTVPELWWLIHNIDAGPHLFPRRRAMAVQLRAGGEV
ncbi:MAG TPA: hypothetical protein VN683_01355, partial [Acidothermaceae bacterium]|nr:hypothetical protein [Acidothermaceae bacterium]